eukprot:10348820-Alexandrium_andersonii.AAC.1
MAAAHKLDARALVLVRGGPNGATGGTQPGDVTYHFPVAARGGLPTIARFVGCPLAVPESGAGLPPLPAAAVAKATVSLPKTAGRAATFR